MGSDSQMITIDEAEQEFGMKRATIYKYAKRGDIRTYRRPGDRKSYVQRDEMKRLREFRPRYSVDQHGAAD
ncbi:MAG: helix-turn-helix domain-containing protein [Chloroflexi bacterium]|nr:helix-turn-helix domain-containing protein [Chloroflexota bacterium]